MSTLFYLFASQSTRELTLDELDQDTVLINFEDAWLNDCWQWSDTDEQIQKLTQYKNIILPFPKFVDGRSYSLARLLKKRINYQGQLLASGSIADDQIPYLKQIGFDGFQIAIAFTVQYWTQVVDQRLAFQPTTYQVE